MGKETPFMVNKSRLSNVPFLKRAKSSYISLSGNLKNSFFLIILKCNTHEIYNTDYWPFSLM